MPTPKRWAQGEDGKEYPISTDRAEAISRWIREAPLSLGGAKKRRPARKKKAPAQGDGSNGVAEGVAGMTIGGAAKGEDEEVD